MNIWYFYKCLTLYLLWFIIYSFFYFFYVCTALYDLIYNNILEFLFLNKINKFNYIIRNIFNTILYLNALYFLFITIIFYPYKIFKKSYFSIYCILNSYILSLFGTYLHFVFYWLKKSFPEDAVNLNSPLLGNLLIFGGGWAHLDGNPSISFSMHMLRRPKIKYLLHTCLLFVSRCSFTLRKCLNELISAVILVQRCVSDLENGVKSLKCVVWLML